MRAAGLLGALLVLAAGGARAAEATCEGYGLLSEDPPLALGRVAGSAPRAYFLKGEEALGCPAATQACRAQAFLVPGNRVILGATRGIFVCADYVGARGADRAGWLPLDAVVREAAPPVAPADWLGRWSRQAEGDIAITPAPGGALAIRGDASFGGSDPARVRRGAVNMGSIEARVVPQGASLSFAMGSGAKEALTLPVEKGDPTDCKVWMRRLGPWLPVDDDHACGGMNVTFRGIYRRQP